MRHKKAVNLYSWKGFVTKELTCIVKTFNWFSVIDMIWYREDKSICYDSWERKSWALMGKICAPVGVEDPHIIPNAQITTSSYYLSYYPHMGRLSGVKDWCQKTTAITEDYIQVNMRALLAVCAIATQGKKNGSFVKSYRLSFSTDESSRSVCQDQNIDNVWNNSGFNLL